MQSWRINRLDETGVPYLFWSNAFRVRAPFIKEAMTEFYGLDPSKIIISSEHKASKYNRSSFAKIAQLCEKDARALILVDDSETYVTNARASGMRALTFRGNPYRGITPQQRLIKELRLAGLYPEP